MIEETQRKSFWKLVLLFSELGGDYMNVYDDSLSYSLRFCIHLYMFVILDNKK